MQIYLKIGTSLGSTSSSNEFIPWMDWFCSLEGHDFFVKINEDFILDEFNLQGLSHSVPHYEQAISTILDYEQGF